MNNNLKFNSSLTSANNDITKKTDFVVDIEGFEGPLDLLLALSREHKIDLRKIAIVELAEQYLVFIDKVKELKLELAADYLVMAAWLAYLKSKLFLPVNKNEANADELAENLTMQLQRLAAIRQVSKELFDNPRLGIDVFPRGEQERIIAEKKKVYSVSLIDLLRAYSRSRTSKTLQPLIIKVYKKFTIKDALEKIKQLISSNNSWVSFSHFLQHLNMDNSEQYRSVTASTFVASLELAKLGEIEISQANNFSPIHLRGLSNE